MALFGSFALLIALALAAWNLLAGALALRMIATGQAAAIAPERLADTARRAGIAGFWAVTAAAFALLWAVFPNNFPSRTSWSTRTVRCRRHTSSPRYGRAGLGKAGCGVAGARPRLRRIDNQLVVLEENGEASYARCWHPWSGKPLNFLGL